MKIQGDSPKHNQTKTSDGQMTSLVALLDRTMTASFGGLWSGIPKTKEQSETRLLVWGHLFSTLDPKRVAKAITRIPAECPKAPTPGQFKELYTGTHVDSDLPLLAENPKKSRAELKSEAKGVIDRMKDILAASEPPPSRHDPAYPAWANPHRKVLGLQLITSVKPDGSFNLDPPREPQMMGSCRIHGCHRTGAISSSTKGADSWLCGEHYMAMGG